MAENPLEIPQSLRDVSEQNLKQARAAYEQFTDFVTKAMGAWTGAMPNSHSRCLRGCARPRHANRNGKCRVQLSRSPARSARHRISRRL